MNDEKVKCVVVTRPETHGDQFKCIYRFTDFSVSDEFDGADEGESIKLTFQMMTKAEVDALPEFEGW